MKEIKGKTHSVVSIFFLIGVSGLIIYKGYKSFGFIQTALIIVFMLFVYWLFTYPGHYYFLIDRNELNVRNTLNPFIDKRINLKDVELFNRINASYYGNAIQIILKGKKKKVYPISIRTKELEKIIEELNSLLN